MFLEPYSLCSKVFELMKRNSHTEPAEKKQQHYGSEQSCTWCDLILIISHQEHGK